MLNHVLQAVALGCLGLLVGCQGRTLDKPSTWHPSDAALKGDPCAKVAKIFKKGEPNQQNESMYSATDADGYQILTPLPPPSWYLIVI